MSCLVSGAYVGNGVVKNVRSLRLGSDWGPTWLGGVYHDTWHPPTHGYNFHVWGIPYTGKTYAPYLLSPLTLRGDTYWLGSSVSACLDHLVFSGSACTCVQSAPSGLGYCFPFSVRQVAVTGSVGRPAGFGTHLLEPFWLKRCAPLFFCPTLALPM